MCIQGVLVVITILHMVGITKRKRYPTITKYSVHWVIFLLRFLMLPWLVVWGLSMVVGMVGAVLCVMMIPGIYKLLSVFLVVVTVFLVLPTWFFSLHMFSDMASKHSRFPHDSIVCEDQFYRADRKQDLLFRYLYA